ncbi:cytochrome b/b6 domain-containing protein [Coraliomargarita parva]|uniref:cytochrome b/b6 domain-containing protein n=1 Tax=Coraliomargarita parva TaxID=3014050 RepID=UPI0022B2C973|nr:cytochrome b/b6 domain-containing protein [Coraliomargarita parva]
MRLYPIAFTLLSALFGSLLHASEPAPAFDNADCFLCHDDDTAKFENGPRTGQSIYVNPETYSTSVHAELTCIECHEKLDVDSHPDGTPLAPVSCAKCHEDQSASYGVSAHGANGTLKHGEDTIASPSCSGCHGTHNILSPSKLESPLNFLNLTETCGQCHTQVATDIRDSVHGSPEARGRRESPVCTDCHSEHAIAPLERAASIHQSGEVCAQCHASERLNSKYGIEPDRVGSYQASYHGLATRLGDTAVANCASCHGYHLILNSENPRSSINPANLRQTCGECHPGASERFVSGEIHHPSAEPGKSDLGARVNLFVRSFYKLLIVVVIGFMLFHNGLAWRRRVLKHLNNPRRTVVRMSPQLRIQHALLAGSFIYLALSGFALAYPDSILAWVLGGHEGFRRWSHRIVGVFMLLLGGYHVLFLLIAREGRQLLRDIWVRWQDFRDIKRNLAFYLNHKANKARFGRFGYPEKLEYWAVFWGTLIMGLSGFLIWLKIPVTQYLPRWIIEVATSVHFYEAVLAVLAIIVWHLYHVIFDPGAYPMNGAWLDGKVTPEWMEEEHPLAERDDAPQPGAKHDENPS